MLAGLVQNPDANNPVNNLSAAIDRRDVVINRMAELKMITPAQVTTAKRRSSINVRRSSRPATAASAPSTRSCATTCTGPC